MLPTGAQPANDDFMSSWTRTGRLNAEEERSVKEWCVLAQYWMIFARMADVDAGSATKIAAAVAEADASLDYLFMSEAHSVQPVLASYGEANVRRLQAVQKLYDPDLVFQKLVPGGQKLPARE